MVVIGVNCKGSTLFKTVYYELFHLSKEAKFHKIDAMLYSDASVIVSTCSGCVISRDMLSLDKE